MKSILTITLFTWIIELLGQVPPRMTPEQLKQDFEILQTTLKELHPNLYRYTNQETLTYKFDSVFKTLNSELKEVEFYQRIAPLVALIKNGHTALRLPDSFYDQVSLLPLRLLSFDKRIFVRDDLASPKNELQGFEIVKINEVNVDEIIRQILPYVSLDGFNDNARYKAAVEDDLAYYYSALFGQPEYFELVLRYPGEGKITKKVKGISNSEFNSKYSKTVQFPWTLTRVDTLGTAVMRLGSFSNSANEGDKAILLKTFLKHSFKKIKEWKVEQLVLDLRDNGGGELKNSILLYSYLTDDSFRFTKAIEITTIDPPTYVEYTDYNKSLKFDSFDSKNIIRKNGELFLKDHFSMMEHKPNTNNFKGKLYIIMNGQTGSSAGCFSAIIHSTKRGKIIGEENRDNYTGYTAGVPVTLTLPNSKIKAIIPLRTFTYTTSADDGRGVIPDYVFEANPQDFFNGKDSEIKFVLDLIEKEIMASN